jgi:hypothetical protein
LSILHEFGPDKPDENNDCHFVKLIPGFEVKSSYTPKIENIKFPEIPKVKEGTEISYMFRSLSRPFRIQFFDDNGIWYEKKYKAGFYFENKDKDLEGPFDDEKECLKAMDKYYAAEFLKEL